jgi:predicted ester cyclase
VSADPAGILRAFADLVWNQGDFSSGEALFGAGFQHHDLVTHHDTDLDGYFDSIRSQRRAFPGVQFSIADVVANGDRIATRWIITGEHADSGRRVVVNGMSIDLLEAGRIVENWTVWDRHGLLEQLGRTDPQ